MKLKGVIYMVVTNDKYELPIYVADTVEEIAQLLGIKNNSVSTRICRGGYGKKYKIIRVRI